MWQLTPIFLIIHCAYGVQNPAPRIDPLVDTDIGLIRGLRSENGLSSNFFGIPYAVVDEENPFAPASSHPGFSEAFNAYNSSISCPQQNMQGIVGQIQCLTLNVFVPNSASSRNKLPVMLYIHGGAFIGGDNFGVVGTASKIVEKEVVVVTINYRLGIYGFLCTESPKAPGNIGLRDQLLALRWVNEHIESFGGDKNKVTIFGESAGGMSVHLHLLSHHEKLFDKAIIESGAATSPWTFVDVDNLVPLRIAQILGFETENVDEAIDFIAKTDVHLAIAAGTQIKNPTQYTNEPQTKVCVEKEFEGIERFVTINPNEAKSAKAKTVPVLIGFAEQELIFSHSTKNTDFYKDYSFKNMLSFGFDVSDFDDMAELVKHFYIGDESPSDSLADDITSFGSDFVFNHPTERAIDLLLESDAKAVYHYKFTYVGDRSTIAMVNSTVVGASHTDEIFYLFANGESSADDQLIVDRVTTMWTNFAKYGDPVPETTELLPVKWEPVSKESRTYLNINKELKLESRPFHDRMAFWDLFYKLNEQKTKWYNTNV